MSVRKFRILNKDNKYLDFMDLDMFAHKPEGLGFEIERSFYNSFNSYSDVVQASKQSEIKFNVIFGHTSNNPYVKYNIMLHFLNIGGLKLEYTVPNVGTFLRDVEVSSITKTDLDEYGVLQETITFIGLTPWYSWIPLTTALDPIIDGGIIYDDDRNYLYDHTAWGWGTLDSKNAILKRFSTRYPRFNMLAGTRNTITFKGYGGSIPKSWHVSSDAKAEIINVYDSDFFKAGMHVTSDGEATVSMEYSGAYNHGDGYIQSYYIRNQGHSPIVIEDKIIAITKNEHVKLINIDGSADKSWIIPPDGHWHKINGTCKKFPDDLDINTITEVYSQAYCSGGKGTDFVLGAPKLEIGQWDLPLIDSAKHLHTAYAYSADGTDRFTTTYPNLNLLDGTRDIKPWATGYNIFNQDVAVIYFNDHKTVADLFKVGDIITLSSDIEFFNTELYNSSNDSAIRIQMFGGGWRQFSQVYAKNVNGKFYTKNEQISSEYVENPTHKVNISITMELDKHFIESHGNCNAIRLIYDYIPKGADTKLTNLKIEPAKDLSSTATPWMPSFSEVTTADWPSYVGHYTDHLQSDSNNPFDYTWSPISLIPTPWMPSDSEIEAGDYPTHYGVYKSNDYKDSEVSKDYTWLPLTDMNNIIKRDANHSDLQDGIIHKAYSWSADGTKGFTNTTINPNVFNESDLTTGFLSSTTGEIISSGVSTNHQITKSKVAIPDGAKMLVMTVYNPNKVAQTTTHTNRIGIWNKDGSYNRAFHQLPLITADTYQVHNIPIPANAGQLRIGVIHGPARTKTSDWKFKFEFATEPSPYTPWFGSMRNSNLLVNSSVHNTLVGGTPTIESPNYLMDQVETECFKAGDSITLSYKLNIKWPSPNTATVEPPTISGKLIGGTYKPDFPSIIIKPGILNVYYKGTITLDEDFIVNNQKINAVRAIGSNLPKGMTVEVYNLKIENGYTATPWIAHNTETDDTDYPSYQGLAVNHNTTDSSDPKDYIWSKITDFNLSDRIDQSTDQTIKNELTVPQEQQGFNVVSGTNVTSDLLYPFVNRLNFANQVYKTGGILFVDFDWEFSGNTADMKGRFNPQMNEDSWGLNDSLFKPVYITPNNLSGHWSKAIILNKDIRDPLSKSAKFFGFRMDNCSDNGIVTISNMKLQYYPKRIMLEHLAFAWSADGVKNFTSSFPKPNLLQSTRLTGSGVTGADSGIALPFDNGGDFNWQSLEAGDVITISFDWSAKDTANQFAGRFIPTFITYPQTMGNNKYVIINDRDRNGHYESSVVVTQDMIEGGTATKFGFMFDSMDGTEIISIDNLKLELFAKNEIGYGINATPWMPGKSEAIQGDYPNLIGTYTDSTQQDINDSSKYSWSIIGSPETVESNDQPSGAIKVRDGSALSPYRIVYNDTTIYQADYSKSASFLQVNNESMYFGTQSDSSFRISIKATPETGVISNPSWYLTDITGKKLQTEGFLTSIPVGFELVVSSDSFERSMVIRDSNGILPDASIDELMDPTVSGWLRVPIGISRIVLSNETYAATGGFNGGRIIAEYKQEWVGI